MRLYLYEIVIKLKHLNIFFAENNYLPAYSIDFPSYENTDV